MLRRTLIAAALTAACAGCASVQAHVPPEVTRLSGPLSDIEIIDRDTGRRLPIYTHSGRRYVAGTPGSRYAVAIRNRGSARVLAVIAVDGINAVSGESAAWNQTGYVLGPYQRYEVRGWRKSQERIAAFEFTSIADSYAARTGRPNDVGVIGVALFREAVKPEPMPLVPQATPRQQSRSDASNEAAPSSASPPAEAPAAADKALGAAGRAESSRAAEQSASRLAAERRLGTGHGRSEGSHVSFTDFERARPQPDELITIHYDSRANLIALGVIAPPVERLPPPNPFPGSLGFVPDPPR